MRKCLIAVLALGLAACAGRVPGRDTVPVEFRAPSKPGKYVYVCTYPGHARFMQGTLVSTP